MTLFEYIQFRFLVYLGIVILILAFYGISKYLKAKDKNR